MPSNYATHRYYSDFMGCVPTGFIPFPTPHLAALHLLHQLRQLCAEARGLGFVIMHDGVFKQRT